MEIRTFKSHLTVIGLMLATSLALAFTVNTQLADVAGIDIALPDKVGDWTGEEIRFCQNAECQSTFTLNELADPAVCPKCQGKLDSMSLPEKSLLPGDTILLKKQYKNERNQTIFASVVVSGKERASIHRPEVCLVGQGSEIVHTSVIDVPIANRDEMQVMMLDMLHRRKMADGSQSTFGSYYAYWFVGNKRETPYHWQRMMWMATDRIFHNVAHRWAYISVSAGRQLQSEEYKQQAADFITLLYPQMISDGG